MSRQDYIRIARALRAAREREWRPIINGQDSKAAVAEFSFHRGIDTAVFNIGLELKEDPNFDNEKFLKAIYG